MVQARQLVQQRLLVLGTGQQLLLGLAVALQLGPANEPTNLVSRRKNATLTAAIRLNATIQHFPLTFTEKNWLKKEF